MPTYVCTVAKGRLSHEEKNEVVKRLSKVHSQEGGGVPEYLVQVVFNEIEPGNHFINKRPVLEDQIWIRGDIRAGRTEDQKNAMAQRMMAECAEAVGIDASFLWVYICDAEKTAEFGSILPKPGEEQAWVAKLPREVRDRYGLY